MSLIKEAFAGKRVLLTGVTGFLGTALFERILVDLPVERIDVVIRGDATERLRWLLAGSAFGPARERLGPLFEETVAAKVRPVTADLSAGAPEVDSDIDLVIHSAATVQFDPPIDEAFSTNLLGSTRLYEASAGRPFFHVSTAYVAGRTKGIQKEELLQRDIDWRAETEAAMRMRDEVDYQSRRPEILEALEAKARSEVGRAGPRSVARRAEELRREWVHERLVRAGKSRARSLGWPEVYSFTKALTELALDEIAGDGRLTIIRPSIIESALERPFPGWIEGFRMADPVILGYGRGNLPDFPGSPDVVLDVIPVDLVVGCILASVAAPPERRAVYHSCSGSRNPITFRQVYEHTREYFLAHPLPEARGSYKVPEWKFPGRRAIEKKISSADRMLAIADKVVDKLPFSGFARDQARNLDRFRRRLDFVKRLADLYGPYAEAEVIYTDEHAQALQESLPEEDRRDFSLDPTSYTWTHYLQEVHLPMLTAPLRWVPPRRTEPSVSISPNGSTEAPVLAVFDVEGTVVASNVVEAYWWLRMSELEGVERVREAASLFAKVPGLMRAESRDRGEFLRRFYREYKGVSVEALKALAGDSMPDLFLRRIAPGAVRRIRKHREAGHRVIFITASLDFVIEPVAPLAHEVIAARLAESEGRFTGDVERPPIVGEARASWLEHYAAACGADPATCYGYADSMSDLPLLEAVGNPVAVNPDVSLARIARARAWPVEIWETDPGTPRVLIPEKVL